MKPFTLNTILIGVAVLLSASQSVQSAPIFFDDFNVNEGHFPGNPNASGTSTGTAASSTADRITTDAPVEGSGHERLVLKYNGTSAAFRCRFLSGGGAIGNNVAFTTTDEIDGKIGYYVKTTATGWVTSINLDGPAGGIPDMDGSTSVELIADGEWHLYEWDLDTASDWGSVPAIGGGHGGLQNVSHTIDSIYFRFTGATLPTPVPDATIFLDFVALNPSGSVSDLLSDPCLNTSGVLVGGPISADIPQVRVAGVSGSATNITIYQRNGTNAMAAIASKSSGIVAGDNFVTVTNLVKGDQVAATQTINGQESCVPQSGLFVGGGANPSVRVALTIRETSSTGPVGTPGDTASGNLHFLGASAVSGGSPIDASVIYPSNSWQTLTFKRGIETVSDAVNANGNLLDGSGYAANDFVSLQVFAYRTTNNVTFYSINPSVTPSLTSNDVFAVNWTWDTVAGAQGYRLLRSLNFGAAEYIDVLTNNYTDANAGWITGDIVTPNSYTNTPSIQWNPSVGNPNNIATPWGIVESINFAIDNPGDTGPFDVYIDNLQNGTNVFQTFEEALAGTTAYAFRAPGFSGTTFANMLSAPDVGEVSNGAADTGTKSFHLRFQWSGTNASKWLRLTTTGQGLPTDGSYPFNPQVNLDEPISLRLLLLPVGTTPTAPPRPVLSSSLVNGNVVLEWTGAHNLQMADVVTGPYTNVPNATTSIPNPTPSPFTNAPAAPQKFFRLAN